jgi:putative spermidine/putrescine transport system ATP-binding protein
MSRWNTPALDLSRKALARGNRLGRENQTFVVFAGVEKTYDGVTNVIENLTLEIHRGEFFTLLGPSGSGKTTTLMMLAGFEDATGGTITFDGKGLDNVPPYARNMGVVFQNYALFPHMTVERNVAFPLKQRRLSRSEIADKVARALAMVRLEDLGERLPQQLSGGQQQRVALARALAFEPDLVLLDEPLGALDKKLREQMQLEIKRLHEELGVTMVYVTHDQQEALVMSDRIAVFRDGLIQQVDIPGELYEHPANSFVADFIGENNRLHGTVETVNGAEATVVLSNGMRVVAKPVNIGGAGARTTLSIRPERVAILPNPDRCRNRFTAEVQETIYVGSRFRVRLKLADSDTFVAEVSVSDSAATLRVGDVVDVGWEVEHCRALDPA